MFIYQTYVFGMIWESYSSNSGVDGGWGLFKVVATFNDVHGSFNSLRPSDAYMRQ